MTPTTPPDDSYWSSLAEELEVSRSAPAEPTAAEPAHDPLPDAPEEDEPTDTMVEIDLSSEPLSEDGGESEAGEGDGEPGRKKRRRRRRRRKGGDQPGDDEKPAAAGESAADDEEDGDDDLFGEQGGGVTPAAAEEPPAELAREVIANWDVPSWDEIVAGLYRPGGR